jgi:hypothetical protein
MASHYSVLDQIAIRKPCNADWDAMTGSDEVRFCEHCAKDVHNLSAITKLEAEQLVADSNGKLCVRYYQLPNGRVETTDSFRRMYPITRKLSNVAAGLFTVVLATSSTVLAQETGSKQITVSRPEKQKVRSKSQSGKPAGAVSGTVFDINHAVIVNARIELTKKNTGAVTFGMTDEMGRFSIAGLEQGQYQLKISATGFKSDTMAGLRIKANKNVSVESVLNVGASMGEVIIVEPPPKVSYEKFPKLHRQKQ